MKISVFSALYPPEIIGGAEISAANLSRELIRLGHEIQVLTTANGSQDTTSVTSEHETGLITRVKMPRPYAALNYGDQPGWKKALWHAQDHLDPYNTKLWESFIRQTQPDVALVQVTQGLGFNGLSALAQADVPTVYVVHDFSLACFRTSMFRNGKTCEALCAPCQLSNGYKNGLISGFGRLGFVAPSQAVLNKLSRYVPISEHRSQVILNPNTYPAATVEKQPSDVLKLLYVGQITESKGVEFLLSVFDSVRLDHRKIMLTVVGEGPALSALNAAFGDHQGITFTGKVPMSVVANYMAESDVLCVPSLWFDNSPGVIIQALSQGLPVLASRDGGIVELIEDGQSGRLLPPGDPGAWQAAIVGLLNDRADIAKWSTYAITQKWRFEPHHLAKRYEAFLSEICNLPAR